MPYNFSEEQAEQIGQARNKQNAPMFNRMQEALLLALLLIEEESAGRILQETPPVALDSRSRWQARLRAAQSTEGKRSAMLGYNESHRLMWEMGLQTSPPNEEEMFSVHMDAIDGYFIYQAQKQTQKIIENIDQITEKAKKALAVGVTVYTAKELAGAYKKEFKAFSKNYARMVAGAGATWAMNEGVLQKYAESGISFVEWYTAGDEKVCPSCSALDGLVVGVGEAFTGAGEILRSVTEDAEGNEKIFERQMPDWSVTHPPLHIGCRCYLLPVVY